jgi:hypothetical protein
MEQLARHLQRSDGGTLEWRLRVPADLRDALGRTELKLGLGIREPAAGAIVAAHLDTAAKAHFARLRRRATSSRATSKLPPEVGPVLDDAMRRLEEMLAV